MVKIISVLFLVLFFLPGNCFSALCRKASLVNGGESSSCGTLNQGCRHGVVSYSIVGNEVSPGVYGSGSFRIDVEVVGGNNAIYLLDYRDPMAKGVVNKHYSGDGHFDYWKRINRSGGTTINPGYDGTIDIILTTRNLFHYEGRICGYVGSQAATLETRKITVNIASSLCTAPPIIDSFATSDVIIPKGGKVDLSWNVSGASTVMIAADREGIQVPVPSPERGTVSLVLDKTTTFTLTASNSCDDDSGPVQKQITVTVPPGAVAGATLLLLRSKP